MNYNELKFLATEKGYTIESFAHEIGISPAGLKKGIDSCKLGMDYIIKICNVLSITPNKFFGWENDTQVIGNGIFASHVSGGNTQNSNEAILALKDELKAQRAIIKEKDKQINRLLTIIERNKLK